MRRVGAVATAVFACLGPAGGAMRADGAPPRVSAEVRAAVRDYLEAAPKKEGAALSKALALLKDDVALAAEALRTHPPLEKAKPGVQHGKTFQSGGKTWEYSILLPKGYDGEKRFPVLVLPDHGSVGPEDGIGFWEGKQDADEYVVFRPVIAKFQEDRERFHDQQFPEPSVSMARVMGDALAALRLRYAVDPDRLVMTGLSQAGFYTWFYAANYPDAFAAIVPESSGGGAVRAYVLSMAPNLAALSVRILHTDGDKICPIADARAMHSAIVTAGGKPELVVYTERDYPGDPGPNRHPGPWDKRISNVLPWGLKARREIPRAFTRTIRYPTQGFEGRFRVEPPEKIAKAFTLTCEEKDGALSADRPRVVYLVSPEDVIAGKEFRAKGKTVVPKGDVKRMLTSFKSHGDVGRLVAAEIPCGD